MNVLFVMLQAEAGAAPAGAMGGGSMMWIMLIAMFAIMYLFMIRPQNTQRKELEQFRASLKKGDKVVTVGGIYGIIEEVSERTAIIKVDGAVKLKVDKNSLVRDYTQDTPQQ